MGVTWIDFNQAELFGLSRKLYDQQDLWGARGESHPSH
jgi:hypothetical protein